MSAHVEPCVKQATYKVRPQAEPEGGYTVTVPRLPGCVTWGRDYDEALAKARESIVGFVEALEQAGEPVPMHSRD